VFQSVAQGLGSGPAGSHHIHLELPMVDVSLARQNNYLGLDTPAPPNAGARVSGSYSGAGVKSKDWTINSNGWPDAGGWLPWTSQRLRRTLAWPAGGISAPV